VIIDKLNGAMVAALADPAIAQQLEVQGLLSSATTPAQFRDTIRDDYAKWKKVLARR
jgi:tripartite-type tricarboxylate transporter receptor subunit TctC